MPRNRNRIKEEENPNEGAAFSASTQQSWESEKEIHSRVFAEHYKPFQNSPIPTRAWPVYFSELSTGDTVSQLIYIKDNSANKSFEI